MYRTDDVARWASYSRWIASIAIAVMVGLLYAWLAPAFAQDRGPGKPADNAKSEAAAAEKSSADKKDEAVKKAEAALAEGDSDKKEAARPAAGKSGETFDVIEVVRNGGVHMWAVYAILAVSVLSVAFAIERFLGLRRGKVLPGELVAGLKALISRKGEFDVRHAMRLCKQYPSSAAAVVRAMLAKVGRPMPEIEHAVTQTSEREATRLYANVRWQNLAFNVAPMLGLAGTVYGVILAFFATAHMQVGENRMDRLATGIYAALVCTFAGLIVAIPAGILAHFFEGRILRLFDELDDLIRVILPQLERFEGRPRLKAHGDNKAPGEPAVEAAAPEPPVDGKGTWPEEKKAVEKRD